MIASKSLGPPRPSTSEICQTLISHLENLYAFYGAHTGVRVARKHISWYSKGLPGGALFRHAINQVETADEQLAMIRTFFQQQAARLAA